jgi:hypothetical protein
MLGLKQDALSIYLNDHLAGSTAGLHLARRLAGRDRDGGVLEAIAAEIEEDRRTLEHVMDRLGVGHDRARAVLGWGIEHAARLKPNGNPLAYTSLDWLEDLEALSLGVAGKLALWEALRRTRGSDPRLADVDLGELADRARSQRRRLESRRIRAAEEALAG